MGFSHAPTEPNTVSNFVHTKTPFGRGYDYEIGNMSVKMKGDVVSGVLGHDDMTKAVEKHVADSKIVDAEKLKKIISDPEFKPKLREHTTAAEKVFLGIPVIDLYSYLPNSLTNSEGSDLNTSEHKDKSSNDSKENVTLFKKQPLRKWKTEPVSGKKMESNIKRRHSG